MLSDEFTLGGIDKYGVGLEMMTDLGCTTLLLDTRERRSIPLLAPTPN